MKKFTVPLALLFAFGCSTTTVITYPDGDVLKVKSRNDSIVRFVKDGKPHEIDNRGNPSVISQMLQMMFVNGDWFKNPSEEVKKEVSE